MKLQRDISGQRFGRLVAIRPDTRTVKGWMWECQCDCGKIAHVVISHLCPNGTKSCGCYRREIAVDRIRHTHTGRTKNKKVWLLWHSAKMRAKRQNVPFGIDLIDIIIPKICPLLNTPLEFGIGKICATSPTLDKIIPTLGYVPGNIQVISARANHIKLDATLEELETVVRNWKASICQ